MSGLHHLFAPSAAHRWMVCAPSRAVEQQYEDVTSYEAAEGTVAHLMASTCLQADLDASEVWVNVPTAHEDGHEIPIDDEMREHVQSFIDYVRDIEGGREIERALVLQTDRDYGGRPDVLIWAIDTEVLHVIDFKYGKGVMVKAKNNKQLLSYALLAMIQPDNIVEPKFVRLHVHQPRRENIDSWAIDAKEMIPFSVEVGDAITKARTYFDPSLAVTDDDFTPGEHCQFCKHAPHCNALRSKAIINAQMVFGDITEVPTPTLEEILEKADMIDVWIAAARQEALDRALKGERFERHKVVWKRPTRKWVDEKKAAETALDNLIDIHDTIVLTPPALEKRIGKPALAKTFNGLIQSVSSGLTLVSVDDRREAVNPATAAAERAALVFTKADSLTHS